MGRPRFVDDFTISENFPVQYWIPHRAVRSMANWWSFRLTRRTLDLLDQYEEFDPTDPKKSLFVRKKAKIRMANGSSREGWIYVYNRHPGKAKLVRGGDYVRSKIA